MSDEPRVELQRPKRRYRVEITQVHDWGRVNEDVEVELQIVGYENIDRHCLPRAGDRFYLTIPEEDA